MMDGAMCHKRKGNCGLESFELDTRGFLKRNSHKNEIEKVNQTSKDEIYPGDLPLLIPYSDPRNCSRGRFTIPALSTISTGRFVRKIQVHVRDKANV